jgi:hypothetical protein
MLEHISDLTAVLIHLIAKLLAYITAFARSLRISFVNLDVL